MMRKAPPKNPQRTLFRVVKPVDLYGVNPSNGLPSAFQRTIPQGELVQFLPYTVNAQWRDSEDFLRMYVGENTKVGELGLKQALGGLAQQSDASERLLRERFPETSSEAVEASENNKLEWIATRAAPSDMKIQGLQDWEVIPFEFGVVSTTQLRPEVLTPVEPEMNINAPLLARLHAPLFTSC